MPPFLSGPGLGLALPQNLYPSELGNAPYDMNTSRVCLQPGEQLPVPAGDWYISLGLYCVLQYLDPITGAWVTSSGGSYQRGNLHCTSDGFNLRVANMTGCLVGCVVTSYGNGSYVQSSTTIAATGTTATVLPVIGGQLSQSGTYSIAFPASGAGYGIAPLVFIPAPPPAANNANGVGGVPASGYATIASGTVTGFTFTNPGAGYPTAPIPVVLPNPTDPNIATGITQASIAFSLVGTGSLTAALVTNSGSALAAGSLANITLTVSGAGATASVVPVFMQTITKATVSGAGTGAGTTSALLTTVGGVPSAGTITNNPDFLNLAWLPRPAQIALAIVGTGTVSQGTVGTIYDGGLFEGTPTPVIVPGMGAGAAGSQAGPTIALTLGGVNDICVLQPAP